MKVLLYTDEFLPMVGGISTYSYEVANALKELSVDVTMLAPNYYSDTKEIDDKLSFKIIRYNGKILKYHNLPALTYKFIKFSKQFDLVHGLTYYSLFPVWIARLVKKIPFYSTLHGTDILTMNMVKFNKIVPPLNIFNKCEQITTSSSVIRNLFLEKFPEINKDKVTAYSYGINNFWRGKNSAAAIKEVYEVYPFLKDKQIVLTVARLDDRKGHEFVIDALAGLTPDQKKEIVYVTIGKGDADYKNLLIKKAKQNNIELHILENISNDQLKVFYAISTVFCMPGKICENKVEGLGLVYLEAAAQGLPSISFKIGGVTDVINHEINGLICAPHDVPDLQEALIRVLFNPEFRKLLSTNTQKKSLEYTWENYVKKLYKI
ncbi:MAG: Endo,4-beta-xylanase [Sphingobacteriales bacterium]|nr:Endo,4-beta-xylanase [Sphingobacteriales bacterium]